VQGSVIVAEESRILDFSLNGTYLGLFTTEPNFIGQGGVEVNDPAYTRQLLVFSPAFDGIKTQSVDVLFPEASVDWGPIVAYGVFSSQVGGQMRWRQLIVPNERRTILAGDQYRLKASDPLRRIEAALHQTNQRVR
jgi:hypothetical protein